MHGILDDQQPMRSHLLFQQEDPSLVDSLNDNYLMMAELYGMQLNAELAVLSACNSGIGQLSGGEGMMSLSRAFSYAGVRSIVMSLWAVSDQSTADLMLLFYKNLKNGSTKANALRQAKLEYLETYNDPIFSHPYYWSGFVMIGDTSPIRTKPNVLAWISGLSLIFLAIGSWLMSARFIKNEVKN